VSTSKLPGSESQVLSHGESSVGSSKETQNGEALSNSNKKNLFFVWVLVSFLFHFRTLAAWSNKVIGWVIGALVSGGVTAYASLLLRRWLGNWFDRLSLLADAACPLVSVRFGNQISNRFLSRIVVEICFD
jgi:hypothetical protein